MATWRNDYYRAMAAGCGMSAAHPNRVKIHNGEHGSHGTFGNECNVQLIHIDGAGHVPHFAANFGGEFELDMTPTALSNFIRKAETELAKLPRSFQYVADHVGGDQ